MLNRDLIEKYINAHSLSWSESTVRSERIRLLGVRALLESNTSPNEAYSILLNKGLKPSSLKTLFVRIAAFYDWAGIIPNSYKEYIKNSPRLFRHAISPRFAPTDLKKAKEAIAGIRSLECRRHAEALINSGLRWNEAKSFNEKHKTVIGKGSKPRRVFGEISGLSKTLDYNKFRRELAKVGLRPHDLRKILATELAGRGADHLDLMRIFGWSNIQTASFYLQPKKDLALEELVKGV